MTDSILQDQLTEQVVVPPVPPRVHPVRIRLAVSCGCGVMYATLPEGAKHASETGHTMDVRGELRTK